jgi:hypothetical protein
MFPIEMGIAGAVGLLLSHRSQLQIGSSMQPVTLPLHHRRGHLFLELHGDLWLLDTGAPTSFGSVPELEIAGARFALGASHMGLTVEDLTGLVAVECKGLLGADVLGNLDVLFDVPNGVITVSSDHLAHDGGAVPMDAFMGIPIVGVDIQGDNRRVFLDTGAQLSYLAERDFLRFPPTGRMPDFYPGLGRFETETCDAAVTIGGIAFTLRCGLLPGILEATLLVAGTAGIIGNQVIAGRTIGYFPRRRELVV